MKSRTHYTPAALSLVALLGAFACSSSSDSPDEPGPGGSSGSAGAGGTSGTGGTGGAGGSSGTAGTGGVGGSSGSGGSPGDGSKTGFVSIGSGPGDKAGYSSAAQFYDTFVGAMKCQFSKEGVCDVTVCELSSTPLPGAMVKRASAGVIDIRGAQIPSGFTLTAGPDADYDGKFGGESLWAGGEAVTIHAAGSADGVGEFSAELTAPHPVTITAPAPDGDDRLTVPRSQDLNLTWSIDAASSGEVLVLLGHIPPPTGDKIEQVSVKCLFPAGDGQATVPSAALSKLPATDNGTFWVDVVNQNVQKVGEYQITTSVSTWGPKLATTYQLE